MNIKEVQKYVIERLQEKDIDEYSLKAKLLISNALDKPKEYLIIHDDEEIEENKIVEIKDNVEKIIKGYPIQYITKSQEFMGLNFFINENVLIPQPDTEILVEETLNIAKTITKPKILDLCTGSGAIAISLAKYLEQAEIVASDISSKAIEVAKINAKNNETEVEFIESNLFDKIDKKFDIIVSNPPYIKTDVIKNLSKEVQNEPVLALDGGQDGLDFYKKIVNNAYKYLEKQGILALEIGFDQRKDVIEIIEKSGQYKEIYSKKDFAGNDRIIICKRR